MITAGGGHPDGPLQVGLDPPHPHQRGGGGRLAPGAGAEAEAGPRHPPRRLLHPHRGRHQQGAARGGGRGGGVMSLHRNLQVWDNIDDTLVSAFSISAFFL